MILIDPGFGFGKNVAHNLELMNGLALFHSLGCPLVLGASRKRTIGALSNEAPADQRLGGSIAFALKAVEQGAQILRVHDVPETVQALRIWRGMRDQALTPRRLGGGVDPELAELAVKRRAADPEAAGDLGHAAAIMADGEADDVGFDIFQRAQVAVAAVEGDAAVRRRERCFAARLRSSSARNRLRAPCSATGSRYAGNARRVERGALALQRGAEQHAGELADVARPAVAHQHRKRVIADR